MAHNSEATATYDFKFASGMACLVVLLIYRRFAPAFYALVVMAAILVSVSNLTFTGGKTLFVGRNFYGVMRVFDHPEMNARFIAHDTTVHGLQSLNPEHAHEPLAYYAGLIEINAKIPVAQTRPLAIVGLGAGTLKCLARAHQQVDLYEINPMAVAIAENTNFFTYLSGCKGESQVFLGDGRIRLSAQKDGRYGMIVMDAFSSDAIPNHLLTREAIAMYRSKLAPGGVLIFHMTNRHIDLWPLLAAQAEAEGMRAYGKFFKAADGETLRFNAYWVVLARRDADIAPLLATGGWNLLKNEGNRAWTDDYINMLPYFKALR